MLPQIIALLAAISYALSFILSKRGMRYSTPVTITFVSLLLQTVVLFSIVLIVTGIPATSSFVFTIFVVAGVIQAVVRQLTYIGIEKIGAARSGPIRASVPLWSAAIAVFFLGETMTWSIGLGTFLVVGGILLISWRASEIVADFRPWYIVAPLLAAILGGVVYPLRRYALQFSDEPLYFGAVVGVVGLFCILVYLALPSTCEKLVWNRDSLGYFIAGGAFESLGLLLVLYALSFGPVVMITPLTGTLPFWVVIGSKLFLRDVEKITPRIVIGALLVVCGTIAITTAAAR
jgi:drug/metabolite transporter, DME family